MWRSTLDPHGWSPTLQLTATPSTSARNVSARPRDTPEVAVEGAVVAVAKLEQKGKQEAETAEMAVVEAAGAAAAANEPLSGGPL